MLFITEISIVIKQNVANKIQRLKKNLFGEILYAILTKIQNLKNITNCCLTIQGDVQIQLQKLQIQLNLLHRAGMSLSSKRKSNVMFTIDIKISGQTMSIPVYEGENHEQLIKRFCQEHVFKAGYKEAIKDKIIDALMVTVKKAEISSALKKKVDIFLNAKQQNSKSKHNTQKSQKQKSQTSTPFKQITEHNSHRKNVSNRHKGAHADDQIQQKQQSISKQKSLKKVQVKTYSKPNCIRKNNANSNKSIGIEKIQKSRSSKMNDPDLIAAYETIYRKTKQPQMKGMAKKYLQQHGALVSQRKSMLDFKKSNDVSAELSKYSPPKIIQQNHVLPDKIQPMHNNSSIINCLTKIEAKQCSNRQRSHLVLKQTPKKPSPKKHRIKYDIGDNDHQVNNFQKYDTEGPRLSRYQLREASVSPYRDRAQRGSISYEKLPYSYMQPSFYDQDRSSFRNEPSYRQERQISLRRTRKYKYL